MEREPDRKGKVLRRTTATVVRVANPQRKLGEKTPAIFSTTLLRPRLLCRLCLVYKCGEPIVAAIWGPAEPGIASLTGLDVNLKDLMHSLRHCMTSIESEF